MASDRVPQHLAMVGARVRVRSALDPLVWLCATVTVPGLALSALVESFPVWVAAIVSLPPVTACLCYVILLFREPERLLDWRRLGVC